jgi:hypothetical protein
MSEKRPDRLTTQASSSDPFEKYLNEGQGSRFVRQAHEKVSQMLTRSEEIVYIAVQKPVVSLAPDSAILTNRRFIIYRPRFFGGASFEDYIWRDLQDAHLEESAVWSTFSLKTTEGQTLTLTALPKAQARRLYAYAQEMEERMLEERRHREMEEKRAAAGGIVVRGGTPSSETHDSAASSVVDPVEKLRQLKEMVEMGLITPQEYEATKNKVLANM